MTVFDRILYDEIRASIMKATRASQLAVLFLSFSARTKKNTGGTPKLVENTNRVSIWQRNGRSISRGCSQKHYQAINSRNKCLQTIKKLAQSKKEEIKGKP